MTEFSEQGNHQIPDRKRAKYQHTIGAVVGREVVGPVIAGSTPDLTSDRMNQIEWHVGRIRNDTETDRQMDDVWKQAYAVSISSMELNAADHAALLTDPLVFAQSRENTAFSYADTSLEEGLGVQKVFPINLAREVHLAAVSQGIEGFEAHTVSDIATMLERPDFQALVLESTKTRPGIWLSFADSVAAPFPQKHEVNLEFQFRDGQVSFTPKFSQFLVSELRRANREGLAPQEISDRIQEMSSGGCPLAHEKPGFTNSLQDQKRLAHLSQLTGKTPEELTARQTTIIQQGMDKTAEWLRAAEPHLDTPQPERAKTPATPELEVTLTQEQDRGPEIETTSPETTITKTPPEILETPIQQRAFVAPPPLQASELEQTLDRDAAQKAAEALLEQQRTQQALALKQTMELGPER